MNRIAIILFSIFILFFFSVWLNYFSKNTTTLPQNISTISQENKTEYSPTPKPEKENVFLFVPYWTLSSGSSLKESYGSLIYFGISANEKGVNKNEDGYKNITRFNSQFENEKNKYLTLRMLDSEANSKVLKDKKIQNKIIIDSLTIAKENSFRGLVLDFETQGLPFESLINRISSFYKLFYIQTKNENLDFLITVYGDNFYRIRPYDIKELAKNSDKVLIMAYDFHKAKGNPGPNFPFSAKETYGYDFKTMIDDFLNLVPEEKLVIIFGLYGYDWKVDEDNQAKESGEAVSFNKIKDKFLSNCKYESCLVKRDIKSLETKITYIDENSINHILWFEDVYSVDKKREFINEKNINQIGYWAYSYFPFDTVE
ncbi:hypothetical protein C4577_04605 [Candidatus Parcubacteria bacterium]|nr:MAG: hypothetical protein C4577_04605 [Candidatus Parcubacteria bacterium]